VNDLAVRTPTALTAKVMPGLVELWLAAQIPSTARAYRSALQDFARYLGRDVPAAVEQLLLGRGAANATALAYRSDMQSRGLANNSINQRLSALRSIVTHARTLDLIEYSLEVKSLVRRLYRDTRGPSRGDVRRMLAAAGKSPCPQRDVAIIACLYVLALRCFEVVGLDVGSVDLAAGVLHVAGKGDGGQTTPITMPASLKADLAAWLAVRGDQPGPLFQNRDNAAQNKAAGRRLSSVGVRAIVRLCGNQGGVRVRPHGLRHAAITQALELTGGNTREVAIFSRHKDVRTIGLYDDARRDMGGKIAGLVAGDLEER
jgi:integrase/recombinase XerC